MRFSNLPSKSELAWCFRAAFFGMILLLPLAMLFLFKVWLVTPANFAPAVKVSGLDLVQAGSSRRRAAQQAAQGRFEEALQSWRIAVANNPGNPALIRSSLRHLMQCGESRGNYLQMVLGYSSWLLRLTGTNTADLELTALVYETYGLNDMLVATLGPLQSKLTPSLQRAYLKALFQRGEISQFGGQWDQLEKRGLKFSNSELDLYHSAYLAGWGPHPSRGMAKKQLEQAKNDPALRTIAHRLQLKVSEQLAEADAYRQSLEVLREQRSDTLADHAGLWQLLVYSGRKVEAVRLLREHVRPPVSGEEAVVLAKAHFDLGFPEQARDVLKRYAPEFIESESVWLSYANLLIHQKRWDDLYQEAVQLRHEAHPLRDRLNGFSYFMQGVAEAHRQRREAARTAFQRVSQAEIRNKVWELSAAETIERLGYPEIARQLLLDVQKDVPGSSEYWLLLAKTAYETKDANLLVTAMSSAYRLRPDDYVVVKNYAAALLSTRASPAQALQLTARVFQQMPDSPDARINHCLALVQNQKFSEAEVLLKTLDPDQLREQDLTYLHFALFELHLSRRRYDMARQHSEKIELQYLLPTERLWFESARQNLEASAAAKAQKS